MSLVELVSRLTDHECSAGSDFDKVLNQQFLDCAPLDWVAIRFPGNCGTARGAEEFLKEALALWGQRQKIRLLRADSGFFDGLLLDYLEQHDLPYIVVAKLTKWVKRAAQRVEAWTVLDEHYCVGEFRLKLYGWSVERRFVVIRPISASGINWRAPAPPPGASASLATSSLRKTRFGLPMIFPAA